MIKDGEPMNDTQRERLIEQHRLTLTLSQDRRARVAAFKALRELVLGRSPETVERMEKEQGLRNGTA